MSIDEKLGLLLFIFGTMAVGAGINMLLLKIVGWWVIVALGTIILSAGVFLFGGKK